MEIDFWDDFMRLRKRYAQVLEPICRQWDLTRNELDILLFLANHPGYDRAADIVERRGLAKSHVSLAVQSLQKRGFVQRDPEPGDRRAAHLCITSAAGPVVAQGQQVQRAFFGHFLESLTPEELAAARQILTKVCKNIDKMEDF